SVRRYLKLIVNARFYAGVRYFMIKSFNYDNVEASQRDGIWATQERNAAVLTEAFNTCRHVILCFSVNKSMGFQGYVSEMISSATATLGLSHTLNMLRPISSFLAT
ncbi:hypothetical protein LTR16_007665, partial [Cryomyces antarcticus]